MDNQQGSSEIFFFFSSPGWGPTLFQGCPAHRGHSLALRSPLSSFVKVGRLVPAAVAQVTCLLFWGAGDLRSHEEGEGRGRGDAAGSQSPAPGRAQREGPCIQLEVHTPETSPAHSRHPKLERHAVQTWESRLLSRQGSGMSQGKQRWGRTAHRRNHTDMEEPQCHVPHWGRFRPPRLTCCSPQGTTTCSGWLRSCVFHWYLAGPREAG